MEMSPRTGRKIRLSSLILLTVIIFTIVWIILCQTILPLYASDVFWQLRAGHDIMQSGNIPHTDTYSWTRSGKPWHAVEWLSFVTFWVAESARDGVGGLWLYSAMILATMGCLLWINFRRTGLPQPIAFAILLGIIYSLTPFFAPRPQIFTYIFLTITACLIAEVRSGRVSMNKLSCLIPLFVLWANFHAGVVVGVIIILLLASGDLVQSLRSDGAQARKSAYVFGAIGGGCALATLLTPFGSGLYTVVWKTIADPSAMAVVREWRPYHFQPQYYTDWFFMGTVIALVALAVNRRLWRCPGEFLVVAVLTYEAFAHFRNIPLLLLAGIPLVLSITTLKLTEPDKTTGRRVNGSLTNLNTNRYVANISFAVLVLAGLWFSTMNAVMTLRSSPILSNDFVENIGRNVICVDEFPQAACSFLENEKWPSSLHMYNDYGVGGFLILTAPDHPVFVDSRADIYLGQILDLSLGLNNQKDLKTGSLLDAATQDALEKQNFDIALTDNELVADYFGRQSDWSLVFSQHNSTAPNDHSPNAWLFLRNRPQFSGLINKAHQDYMASHNGAKPILNYDR